MHENQFHLLKTRRFLPLFITQFLGAFNDNLFKNALVILITFVTAEKAGMNSQIMVTAAAGIFILPFFLFSATAGQFADKHEKSRLVRIIKFVEIVLMILAGVGFYLESVLLLMGVLFMMGAQSTFFGPIKYGILPEHLHEDELIGGNALIEAGTFLSILTGTILGGVLILAPGGIGAVSALVVLFSVLGFAASFYIPQTRPQAPGLKVGYNIASETWKILKFAAHNRSVFLSILGISWFWLVGATFLSQFPTFGKFVLGGDEYMVTLFLTMFSIGIGLGSLVCDKLLKGQVDATFVPLGALGMTVFTVDLFLASGGAHPPAGGETLSLGHFLGTLTGLRITTDLLLIAFAGGLFIVPLYAILQSRSEVSHRSRSIAANNVMNALFMVASALGTSAMLALDFTVPQVFLVVAVLNALVAVYVCKLLPDALVRSFLRWLLNLLYSVEVKGLDNYHKAGNRVMLVANHTSFLDALLFATYIPERLTYAVNTQIAQKWIFRPFLAMADFFTLDPTNPLAARSLIECIRQDKKVVIFPEGRLTTTGSLMKIYEGPGMIADKSQAQVLPVSIEGAKYTPFTRLKGKLRIRLFPKITVTFRAPRAFRLPEDIKGRRRRRLAGTQLYDLMAKTLLESTDYRQTLFTGLLAASRTHGGRHVIAEDIERRPLSYRQFITRCFILGRGLAKHTEKGENVGLLLPNAVSTVVAFFSLHAFGRVPAMLNFSAGRQNLVSACETGPLHHVFTSHRFIEMAKLENAVEGLKEAGVRVTALEDLRAEIGPWDKAMGFIAGLAPAAAYHHHCPEQDAGSPAVILFTSGSEGTPKGVVLSHANLQANLAQLRCAIDFNPTDVVFNAMPVFHSFGLTGGTLLPMLSGIRTFYYPSPLHYRIVPELVYDTNATLMFGTDTFLTGYARYANPYDFYSLRYAFAGAEKLKPETVKVWSEKFGVRLFEGYGATETSPGISINTPMHNRQGTVGRLLPGITHRLEAVPGIEDGGRLLVSGPNIMLGYLKADNPGVLQRPEGGWYDTGDIVAIDEEGYITIKGRAKRFAKIGGEMISLTAVESDMGKIWPEHHHAVVALPDEKKGEQLVLVTDCPEAAREKIVAHAREQGLAELGLPKKIVKVDMLPLLGTGKVDYPGVLQLVREELGVREETT
ncbi:MAG: acyl-[ACP]--phospholipid O-acyltransferase [Nitrospinaceae bacterium]|jgi:acyl-[acyl-carrier-protein]-phospholipid O-acyltransferase/long-chain-fatty-acid--[acyl-carrier-protein] ligase|nr:MAG: acyl-[ACP]--phospholipid O-acyltransferase [Nitrospinaceae bacterium]